MVMRAIVKARSLGMQCKMQAVYLPLGDLEVLEELAEHGRRVVVFLVQHEDRVQHARGRVHLIQRGL